MASGNQMVILYPGISIIKEVYCSFKILISPFCFGVDAVTSNRVMGALTKWRMLAFYNQSREETWR
jgi:hypothetical protein